MKNMVRLVLSVSLAFIVANCGAAREQILTQPPTSREGVFQEVTTATGPPAGFADVVVKASLKTHLPGTYLLESRNSPNFSPVYRFVVNIDGQSVTWEVKGVQENAPIVNGKHFPEEGEGMKYVLEKKIQLRPGTHNIFFFIPEKNSTKAVTVNLQEGKSYTLELHPIYTRHKKWGHPAFRLGILGLSATFDQTASN
jgi:hypothetical protein